MSTKNSYRFHQSLPRLPELQDPSLRTFLKILIRWLTDFQDNYNRLISADVSDKDPMLVFQKQTNAPDATYLVFNAQLDAGKTWRKVDYSSASWAMRFDKTLDKYEILYSPPGANPISWTTHLSYPGSGSATGSTDILTVSQGSSNVTFGDITLNNLVAQRLVASDAAKKLVSVLALTAWIAGTVNQVTVADDGDGTVTLSLPQDIHTGASPTFAGLTLTNIASFAASLITLSDAVNLALGVTTGTKIGTSASQKLGFYGASPVTQRPDPGALTDNIGGVVDGVLSAIPDPADAPASADALRDDLVLNVLPAIRDALSDLAAKVNSLRNALSAAAGGTGLTA